jgi:hypothetical protein
MEDTKEHKSELEKAAEDLFEYAVDRTEVKYLMERLPREADIKRVTVEYELQILKIITVGWSIAFYLENNPYKKSLLEVFWKAVFEFSQGLSETTGLMIGQDIDYFQIIKDRLDMYVDAMNNHPDAPEPSAVIGPEFAKTCGNANDLFTFMTGTKLFVSTNNKVKEYLEAIKLR